MLRPGVVVRGLQVLAENPGAGALTVRIENTDRSEQRGGRRNLMTPWSCLVEQFRLDRPMPDHPHFHRLTLHATGHRPEAPPLPSIPRPSLSTPPAASPPP